MSSNTKESCNIFNVGNLSALFYKVPDGGFKVVPSRGSMLIKKKRHDLNQEECCFVIFMNTHHTTGGILLNSIFLIFSFFKN